MSTYCFFFTQKTAYEMRISDWSSDVCSSDLPVIHALANYFGVEIRGTPGLQHVLDAEYFGRMDAMTFALAHDDGQHCSDIDKADVILVGVSRTSQTPTCMYLANRGIKCAHVPVVPGCPMPEELLRARARNGGGEGKGGSGR